MKNKIIMSVLLSLTLLLGGCSNTEELIHTEARNATQNETTVEHHTNVTSDDKNTDPEATPDKVSDIDFSKYELIEIDGGDLSGFRKPNAVVDIGYGNREYWAFTNEHGQLIRVIADEIVLQDDRNEPVLSNGRYYNDEAKVPGVESDSLDEGHIIADSLGGVSNAYNITPQNSTLNRHGDQAYMEEVIRSAGGATNFEAIITYPNTESQIPSSYQYIYTVKGNEIIDTFENANPDEINESLGLTKSTEYDSTNTNKSIASIDTNGNGIVTIREAKAAGISMPITSDHWLYEYMRDGDGDGIVGE